MAETVTSGILISAGIVCFIWFIWRIFKLPHKHNFSAYNSPFTRYAKCWCGCGISVEEAAEKRIKIRWHDRWAA